MFSNPTHFLTGLKENLVQTRVYLRYLQPYRPLFFCSQVTREEYKMKNIIENLIYISEENSIF